MSISRKAYTGSLVPTIWFSEGNAERKSANKGTTEEPRQAGSGQFETTAPLSLAAAQTTSLHVAGRRPAFDCGGWLSGAVGAVLGCSHGISDPKGHVSIL